MTSPLSGRAHTSAEHFALYFYAAVLYLRERILPPSPVGGDGPPGTGGGVADVPFLRPYLDELENPALGGLAHGPGGLERWLEAVTEWEGMTPTPLPLTRLRTALGSDGEALTLLFVCGLPDEDARFLALFEALHGVAGRQRATGGLLAGHSAGTAASWEVRSRLVQLQDAGLLTLELGGSGNGGLVATPLVWDLARGSTRSALTPWAQHSPCSQLRPLDELILDTETRARFAALPPILGTSDSRTVLMRGPGGSGRHTLLGALARTLGCGTLRVDAARVPDASSWQALGAAAVLLNALPIIRVTVGPRETFDLPALAAYGGPVGVVVDGEGGIARPPTGGWITLTTAIPDVRERRAHWERALATSNKEQLDALAQRFRMPGGRIHTVGRLAEVEAGLAGRPYVQVADVVASSRTLHAQALETLASHVAAEGDLSMLAVSVRVQVELELLAARCRAREQLSALLPPALAGGTGPGVRALLRGPSGTGKTLAARLLAATLSMDLYRLDLTSVVDKYLGETEKNLSRVFARAEELDILLLLDEGDALLTQRTDVSSSNDRYANLETNYLLQRLESYEGILFVTTNAGNRIDTAFQRRMDVVIDFPLPGPVERRLIWDLHLPGGTRVDSRQLDEFADRCVLSGGQIRNAALHAALLALDGHELLNEEHLAAGVRREYRKSGTVCPLETAPASLAELVR
jgi:hypothetical protein